MLLGNKGRAAGAALGLVGALCLGAAPAQASPVAGQGTWESTLKGRDASGHAVALNSPDAVMFYDTALNVTWLANANLNFNSGWAGAQSAVSGLDAGTGLYGHTDWRLPGLVDTGAPGCAFSYTGGGDCGYNVDPGTSEMAHLYYVTLGNLSQCDPALSTSTQCTQRSSGWGLTNTAYFANMINNAYWTGATYGPSSGDAWVFYTYNGMQYHLGKGNGNLFTMALRDGDVLVQDTPKPGPNTVPEPGSLVLALMGLGTLWAGRRRVG